MKFNESKLLDRLFPAGPLFSFVVFFPPRQMYQPSEGVQAIRDYDEINVFEAQPSKGTAVLPVSRKIIKFIKISSF